MNAKGLGLAAVAALVLGFAARSEAGERAASKSAGLAEEKTALLGLCPPRGGWGAGGCGYGSVIQRPCAPCGTVCSPRPVYRPYDDCFGHGRVPAYGVPGYRTGGYGVPAYGSPRHGAPLYGAPLYGTGRIVVPTTGVRVQPYAPVIDSPYFP